MVAETPIYIEYGNRHRAGRVKKFAENTDRWYTRASPAGVPRLLRDLYRFSSQFNFTNGSHS